MRLVFISCIIPTHRYAHRYAAPTLAQNIIATAEKIAREQGLDLSDAATQARATASYTEEIVELANSVLSNGYYSADGLFSGYDVDELTSLDFEIVQGAKYADLAGAIYADDVVSEVHELEHSVVTTGISKDVQWLISDHLTDDGVMERVLTIKGFDATDAEVDRERLVVEIVKATPTPLGGVEVHTGFLGIAQAIYEEVKPFITATAPSHRFVLNGHSIGGSLCCMVMMLIGLDEEVDNNRIDDVYIFGAPPIVSEER